MRKFALAAGAAILGYASLAHALVSRAPDLVVLGVAPRSSFWGPSLLRDGTCNRVAVQVRNASSIAVKKSFEVQAYLGKRRGTGYVYFTGTRHKATVNGLAAGAVKSVTFNTFKITKALKGQNVFIVGHVDRPGVIFEQNDTNNQNGYGLKDADLEKAAPC